VTAAEPGYRFELGKGVTLRDGADVTIVAVGMMVQLALGRRSCSLPRAISARVIDMHTIKPLDGGFCSERHGKRGRSSPPRSIKSGRTGRRRRRVSVGSLSRTRGAPRGGGYVRRSGKAADVMAAYGLTAQGIAAKARKALAAKP
jgi:transketolase